MTPGQITVWVLTIGGSIVFTALVILVVWAIIHTVKRKDL